MAFSSGEVLTAANLNDFNTDSIVVSNAGGTWGAGALGYTDSNWGFVFYPPQAGAIAAHAFASSAGSTLMSITDAGNVGIGTTSPGYDLEVHDTLTVSDGSADFRVWATAGSESFRVASTVVRSSTIVALTTASAANMFINTGNNTIYRSTSSGKYKTDIETLWDEQADKILDLRPVYFRSNPETSADDHPEWAHYGFIAEEVAAIDPRLVNYHENYDEEGFTLLNDGVLEPEGVQYDRMVPALVNIMKRQQTQMDALTARIEALEA